MGGSAIPVDREDSEQWKPTKTFDLICIHSLLLFPFRFLILSAGFAMSDWDASDDETTKKSAAAPKLPVKASKWEGEDEDDDGPVVSLLSTSPNFHAPYLPNASTCAHWVYGIR